MKRTDALKLIANQINFINGKFKGYENVIDDTTLNQANVILTTLESAGFHPPNITLQQLNPDSNLFCDVTHYYACYEPESSN